jgi:hypothetical protein
MINATLDIYPSLNLIDNTNINPEIFQKKASEVPNNAAQEDERPTEQQQKGNNRFYTF